VIGKKQHARICSLVVKIDCSVFMPIGEFKSSVYLSKDQIQKAISRRLLIGTVRCTNEHNIVDYSPAIHELEA
jgi:hypothetical protein